MLNVKFGRWKQISQQAADIALSKYGQTPGPINQDVLKLVMEKYNAKPVEGRPADALAPRMEKLRAELAAASLPTDDEACVLHAMFPREFSDLHKKKAAPAPAPVVVATPAPAPAPAPVAAKPAAPAPVSSGRIQRLAITIQGKRSEVTVEEIA